MAAKRLPAMALAALLTATACTASGDSRLIDGSSRDTPERGHEGGSPVGGEELKRLFAVFVGGSGVGGSP